MHKIKQNQICSEILGREKERKKCVYTLYCMEKANGNAKFCLSTKFKVERSHYFVAFIVIVFVTAINTAP